MILKTFKVQACIFFLLFIIRTVTFSQQLDFTDKKSAQQTFVNSRDTEAKVFATVYLIDFFLDLERLDSCQYWLNQGMITLYPQRSTFLNYLLQTRQTEIYYYSQLLKIGQLSNTQARQIATSLKDSLCLADANHFAGLLSMASGDLDSAINYFKQAEIYILNQAANPYRKYLIKQFNVSNNLAKAYIKLGYFDSAHQQLKASIAGLNSKVPSRGLANYYYLLGKISVGENNIRDALSFFDTSITIAQKIGNRDVELSCYVEKANCHRQLKNFKAAMAEIESGLELYQGHNTVNALFSKNFFATALGIYKLNNYKDGIINVYQKMNFLDSVSNINNSSQAQYILSSFAATEAQLDNMQLQDKSRRQALITNKLIIVLLLVVILLGVVLTFWYLSRQELKAAKNKERIGKDLHDDIGASLSSINILGDMAVRVWNQEPVKSKEMMERVALQSKQLMGRMGDIVWSMQTPDRVSQPITTRLLNYSQELLSVKNIECVFAIDEQTAKQINNPEARKNILLIAKEALNNIAKYSDASKATVSLRKTNAGMQLTISDNGKGFDMKLTGMGNGLSNIKSRCALLKGKCVIESEPGKGVLITCIFPIAIISHKG